MAARTSHLSTARPSQRRRETGSNGSKRSGGIRWDRLARWAMILVLVGIAYLYVGPVRSYFTAWQQAKQKRSEVAKLEAQNTRLRIRRRELSSPQALEREARKLGMVRPGERAYALDGFDR